MEKFQDFGFQLCIQYNFCFGLVYFKGKITNLDFTGKIVDLLADVFKMEKKTIQNYFLAFKFYLLTAFQKF